MLMGLYVCALFFLIFTEKETYKRILLIYLPAFWIGILLLPFTYRVVAAVVDEELYYRFFWMLPMTLVIAYTAVRIYHMWQGKHQKIIAAIFLLLIVISGDFVYNNWRYSPAENKYHVPDSVAEICDLIHAEGREVMAVFPMELLQYVKQYDSTVVMPYGRNILVEDWGVIHPLYNVMEAESMDGAVLGETARQYNCMYVIVPEQKALAGDLSASGYVLKDTLHGYKVFYNDTLFWAIYE